MSNERNYWQRLRRRRLNRRALLGASARAGVGAAGLALVGCGGDDDGGQTVVQQQAQAQPQPQQQPAVQQAQQAQQQTAAQQQVQQQQQQAQTQQAAQQQRAAMQQAQQAAQQEEAASQAQQQEQAVAEAPALTRGGTLRLATSAGAHDYFDPHRSVVGSTQSWMAFYMNYLIRWRNRQRGLMEPDIASLPEIPDDTTYIFSIDQGARFWDQYPTEGGRLVTAEDIRHNVQRQIDGVDAEGAADSTFILSGSYRQTNTMDVLDEQTIRFTTAEADATYMGVHLNQYAWITSSEAITEFNASWRDEPANLALSSGTGPYIPLEYDPEAGFNLAANPNYWKAGADGGMLPYLERVEFKNLLDSTAIDTAYRSQGIDVAGSSLTRLQVESTLNAFPDHKAQDVPIGGCVQMRLNFNADWPGEDGLGNPWADRRVAYAFHLATDRYFLMDTIYLGDAKLTPITHVPWFNEAWAVPQDELITWPGFQPDHDADLRLANELLEASGFDRENREIYMIVTQGWEARYPGIIESTRAMYDQALGLRIKLEPSDTSFYVQRLFGGTFPGSAPAQTVAPTNVDPTWEWNRTHISGIPTNFSRYEHGPAEELIEGMKRELDIEKRQETTLEVLRIFMGVHPDHGIAGMTPQPAVMNGIATQLEWPYVNSSEDIYQSAQAWHRYDETWFDTTHPQFPG